MCFSAQASFTAAALLAGAGVAALRHAPDRRYRRLAAIPLLFALQQALEGVVWMSFEWNAPDLRGWATQGYSMFSHLLWPVYVPWAVRAIEPDPLRRRLLALLGGAGFASATILGAGMAVSPIQVLCTDGHLEYTARHFFLPASLTLYLLATTLSLSISSHRLLRAYGVAAVVAASLAYAVHARWFVSVWCYYAAVLSGLLYAFLRSASKTASREKRVAAVESAGAPPHP